LTEHLFSRGRVDLLAAGSTPVERGPLGAAAKAGPRLRGTETIVVSPLGLVAEHVVGVLHFLEAGLRLLVTRVAVRVILAGQLAVRFLDRLLRGVALHAECLVVIRHRLATSVRKGVVDPRRSAQPGTGRPAPTSTL